MSWLTNCTGYIAPFFIIMSPIISYGDQALSMHRTKSSAGFSLDIPLIMLIASFFRYARALACDGETRWGNSLADARILAESFTGPAPGSIRAC